jgi:hypothetical protein
MPVLLPASGMAKGVGISDKFLTMVAAQKGRRQ